jgi:hypothetical protein
MHGLRCYHIGSIIEIWQPIINDDPGYCPQLRPVDDVTPPRPAMAPILGHPDSPYLAPSIGAGLRGRGRVSASLAPRGWGRELWLAVACG